MAEWSNAAVLKTVDLHGSGGSNPSSSARIGSFLRSDFFLHIVYTPGPARPTDLFLVYSVNTLSPFAMARVQGFESLFFREKKKGADWRLFFCCLYILSADIDLIDLSLLAECTGEEVLGCDDCGAFITLDLLYPELHC